MIRKTPLALLAFLLFYSVGAAYAASFSDVPETSPYFTAAENLRSLGIIKGYGDGTFKPDQTVNRAEALKMILISGNRNIENGLYMTGFPDVPIDGWFAGYVMDAVLNGIISGNPDGTFAPEKTVNRAEFLKMTLKTFNVNLTNHQNLAAAVSNDVPRDAWFAPYFSYARETGIIYPSLQNELMPSKNLTRVECVEILFKILLLINGGETQKMLNISEAKLTEALIQINGNNVQGALDNANEAVFYSDTALKQDPDSTMAKAAYSIAMAFQKLFLGYQAGLLQDDAKLVTLVNEAKNLSAAAVQADVETQPLAQKINELGDELLSQMELTSNSIPVR